MQTKKIIFVTLNKKYSQLITDSGESITINSGDVENTFLTQVVIPEIYKHGSYVWDIRLGTSKNLMIDLIKELNITLPSNLNLDDMNHIAVEAVESDNMNGLNKFTRRLLSINFDREFSAESCLKFLKNTDLPITLEGNILGYKWLNKSKEKDTYVDCHSGKIKQRVGSIVQMDEKYVDPDRSKDCSYGLHIASREYVADFYGDVIAIVLVRPENIIAVPEDYTSKVRVCKYQILNIFDRNSDIGQDIINDTLDSDYISKLVSTADSVPATEVITLIKDTQEYTVEKLNPKAKPNLKPGTAKSIKTKKIKHDSLKSKSKKTNDIKKIKQNLLREDCLNYIREYNKNWTISDDGIRTLELYRKARKKSYRELFGYEISTVLIAEIRDRR